MKRVLRTEKRVRDTPTKESESTAAFVTVHTRAAKIKPDNIPAERGEGL